MSRASTSLRAASVLAALLILGWFTYIAVGWAVAPETCRQPGFHLVSALLVVAAGLAVFLVAGRSHDDDADEESGTVAGFVRGVWLRLSGLFAVGIALAWLLAVMWC